MSAPIANQVSAIRKLLEEHPAVDVVVLASFTREEFAELRPGEDYDRYKRQERAFAEALVREGINARVAFQEIDSAGYYRFLAATGLPAGDKSRAAYAADLHRKLHR